MAVISSYDFTEEQHSHFLRQILQFLTKHKIIPTPLNYTVIYEYVSGSNKALSVAIDRMLEQKKSFDEDLTNKLHNKFIFDASYESFERINKNLDSLISNTSATVSATSQKASAAGNVFEEQASSIASVKNADELKQVITQALAETKGLANVSQSLKTELDSANQEMDQLRAELLKVRESAATDALTGLLNRGAFDKALNHLIEQETSSNACLTMLDLDHFKNVNDTHGHLIGDNVLKITAKLLKKYAEPQHYVARYGGEELAIIMPETSIEKASEIAEQIRESLASSRLKKKNSSESIGQITVSIGISNLKQNDTVEDIIMRADAALYKAKETGRNKVVTEILQ